MTCFDRTAYLQLQHWLAENLPDWSIGSIHGAISAAIACNHEQQLATLVDKDLLPKLHNLPEQLPPQQSANPVQLFEQLFSSTVHQLTHTEFDYQLLLPDDDQPIQMRLVELMDFCDAFVLTFSALNTNTHLSKDLRFLFTTMGDIQCTNIANEEELPSDDTFETLSDFIRMSVINLHSERHKTKPHNVLH